MRFIFGLFRFALTLAGVALCGYLIYNFVQKQSVRSEYNDVIQMINHGKLKPAVAKLQQFLKSTESSVRGNAEKELIKVYKSLGDDPGNTTIDSAKYYQLALGLDPDCLNDTQMKLVEADRVFKH